MKKSLNYRHTAWTCYLGYISQAIIANLPPLLFVTFNEAFGIPVEKIGLLVSLNFGVQILVDLIAAKYVDRIGYRAGVVLSQVCCVIGLMMLAWLPGVMANAYLALVLGTIFNAIGGGLIEVLISPIIESLPGDEKASAMSLLHSFYCWGCVLVIGLSTVFFKTAGLGAWPWLVTLWAIVPFLDMIFFMKVPLRVLVEEEQRMPMKKLLSSWLFWGFVAMMLCAGASELTMSQWASMFAETGLKVDKWVGDLLGPCAFAVLMGSGRLVYGILGSKIDIGKFLIYSACLCVASYLLAVFSPWPVLSLVGCALTGLSVALMWPGTLSMSAEGFPQGGTAMFALMAFAGDIGCSSGPGLVGLVGGTSGVEGIKNGILTAIIFPIGMVVFSICMHKYLKKKKGMQA